jgi:predicted secreted protein
MRPNSKLSAGVLAVLATLAMLLPQTSLAATDVTTARLTCNQASSAPQGSTISRSATLPAGTVLKVALCEYGADGGYLWGNPKHDSTSLTLLSTKDKPSNGPIGSPGTMIWRFRADSASTSKITVTDRRGFGNHQLLLKFVLTVHITA